MGKRMSSLSLISKWASSANKKKQEALGTRLQNGIKVETSFQILGTSCGSKKKRRHPIGRKWRNTSLKANGISSFFFSPTFSIYWWPVNADFGIPSRDRKSKRTRVNRTFSTPVFSPQKPLFLRKITTPMHSKAPIVLKFIVRNSCRSWGERKKKDPTANSSPALLVYLTSNFNKTTALGGEFGTHSLPCKILQDVTMVRVNVGYAGERQRLLIRHILNSQ